MDDLSTIFFCILLDRETEVAAMHWTIIESFGSKMKTNGPSMYDMQVGEGEREDDTRNKFQGF